MKSKARNTRTGVQLLVTCCSLALACHDSAEQHTQQPQPIRQELPIQVLYAAETERFVQEATVAFNRVRNTVGDSATVVLKPLRGDVADVQKLLENSPTQPFLWLAPSTRSATATSTEFPQQGNQSPPCSPLLVTTPALVYRAADSFLFGPEEEPADLAAILEQAWPSALSEPRLVVGHPHMTPSGAAALAILTHAATAVPYEDLSTNVISGRNEELRRVERRIAHRFADEQRMLSWLASRQGGAPLLAVTSDQQLQHFSRQSEHPRLHKRVLSQTPVEITYPLCVFEPQHADPRSVQGIRLARGFLMSAHAAKIALGAGFSEQGTSRVPTNKVSTQALTELTQTPRALPGTSLLSIVIDTSAAFERSLLDALRQQLEDTIPTLRGSPDAVSITSCSTTAETLLNSTRERQQVSKALNKLRPSGGFAFRDCILSAVGAASERRDEFARTTIIVITRGRETQSVADINNLMNLIPRQLDQLNAVLFVVSIGETERANQQLNSMARSFGAVVVPTTQAVLNQDLQALLAELS